ncbi:9208_t:CDS:2 [Paraglomus brasilianum]|uniref:Vacuolar calcium ion transporter n=1 Tax=Paraglomus brasilianum TaxID=144538 RepID=A0A9N9FVA5_9GLOM|nr:9208_t:CDS:2 [Paraglomus brasilianum]
MDSKVLSSDYPSYPPQRSASLADTELAQKHGPTSQHEQPAGPQKKWYRDTKAIVARMKSNWLLLFIIPALIAPRYEQYINSLLIFLFNLLAIIPLARIMTIGLDDIITRLGPEYAAVLHALAGNLVELIISSFALMDGHYAVVRSALLGAILSNILLVMGIIFLAGSMPKKGNPVRVLHADLNSELFVSTSASVLVLAFLALVAPATFKIAAPAGTNLECDLRNISRGTAVILLMLFAGLLTFQLKTHSKEIVDMTEFDHRESRYNVIFDLFLILVSVGCITLCARYLVTSIEHTAEAYRLGSSFVGMVLLPICVMSNAIEHYEAIKHASEEKINTAISLVLNASVQIALLVTPILVLVGWVTQRPLTLDFTALEIAVLGCAVLIINYLVADNKATWLEGLMLLASYIIIAISFFYFPNPVDIDKDKDVFCNAFSRNLPPAGEGVAAEGGH